MAMIRLVLQKTLVQGSAARTMMKHICRKPITGEIDEKECLPRLHSDLQHIQGEGMNEGLTWQQQH